ncbi:hypothetical protein ES703_106356 [subsurface metagenome]
MGQRVELAGVHATGHQVITRPLRSALNQDGRLHLNKPFGIQEITDKLDYPVTKQQVLLHPGPPQVKIAVLQAQVLIYFNILVYVKRWRFGLVEYIGITGDNLDITGSQLMVLGSLRTAGDLTTYPDHIFATQFPG